MKITVITPSRNSAATIETAITSVMRQNYHDVEHIIVDGGSTDGTLAILRNYPHLKWISEPDRNQVHAMNKGFALATGDIIVYLNADDFFAENVFAQVLAAFTPDVDMVVGDVLVRQEHEGRIVEWLNTPKIDIYSILRHWEPNAFCVNPVGYFYKKYVQENVPFQECDGAKMDLVFLMRVAQKFSIKKINCVLGVFNYTAETQTMHEQSKINYWCIENFPFVTAIARQALTEKQFQVFECERTRGYRAREATVEVPKSFLVQLQEQLLKKVKKVFYGKIRKV